MSKLVAIVATLAATASASATSTRRAAHSFLAVDHTFATRLRALTRIVAFHAAVVARHNAGSSGRGATLHLSLGTVALLVTFLAAEVARSWRTTTGAAASELSGAATTTTEPSTPSTESAAATTAKTAASTHRWTTALARHVRPAFNAVPSEVARLATTITRVYWCRHHSLLLPIVYVSRQ